MLIDGFTVFGSWPGLPYDHQVEELISGLERFKVDRACTLSSKSVFFDSRAGNESVWNICQQHKQLIPIGVADPRIGGQEQVDYCKNKGFRLIALFPYSQEWSLTSISAKNVLRRIEESKLPVMIEASQAGDPAAVLGAVNDLSVPVILLDINTSMLTEAVDVLRERKETYLSTRLLCGGDTIEYLAKEVGADRLIFTSRFAISCFSSAFLTAQFAAISESDKNAMMGENMARILGL